MKHLPALCLSALLAALPAAALEPLANSQAQLSGPEVPQESARAQGIRAVLAKITLPPGFRISLYAQVPRARGLALHPSGDVVLVSTNDARIYALRDAKGAGVADDIRTFAPGLDMTMPHGICFGKDGALFVAEQNRVLLFPDIMGDAPAQIVVNRSRFGLRLAAWLGVD